MGRSFVYDLEQAGWREPDRPDQPALPMEQLTGGTLLQSGREVRYSPYNRIIGNVATVTGSRLYISDQGVVQLTNLAPTREVNQPMPPSQLDMGEVNGSVEIPGYGTLTIERGVVTLVKGGAQLWVPEAGPQGRGDFISLQRRLDGTIPQELVPPGWRPATPRETLVRAAMGYVLNNLGPELRAAAAAYADAAGISTKDALYQVALYLALNLEVTPTNLYDFTMTVGFTAMPYPGV